MSLNVDFNNCKCDHFEECEPDFRPSPMSFDMLKRDDDGKVTHHLTYKIQAIITLFMGIGMGEITDKTVDEFIERIELWQDVAGPAGPGYYNPDTGTVYSRITADDIRNHIGLSCNVHKDTWATFNKRLRQIVKDRICRQAKKDEAA